MNQENIFKKNIGKKIKLARSNANFTQEGLAEKTGLSARYISQLERGLAFGSASTIVSICKALNINADFLFSDLINPKQPASIENLIDTKFLQSYIKLNGMNKQFVDLIASQLLKLQDDDQVQKVQ